MQRYDREREPRHQRSRDVERSYSRSDYRNDDRDDGLRAGYGEQDDWRVSFTGYDQEEGYRSDFARHRYGRGYERHFGSHDYQDERGGSRGTRHRPLDDGRDPPALKRYFSRNSRKY